MRNFNTDRKGSSFSATTIAAVWRKGRYYSGIGLNEIRIDSCGAKMRRGSYGSKTEMGWEVDHIKPVSKGGGDELSNLQPLQWENNRHKGDDWPRWSCKIAS